MKNTRENAEQFIHEYEKKHTPDWLSGVPDLVNFLTEYGSKINNATFPNDAYSFEVFSIQDCDDSTTGKQAFIGFKIENGNFHYVGVPYTEPISNIKSTRLRTRGRFLTKEVWYSICSIHQEYKEDCKMCNTGTWNNVITSKISSLIYNLFPSFWSWWVNRF